MNEFEGTGFITRIGHLAKGLKDGKCFLVHTHSEEVSFSVDESDGDLTIVISGDIGNDLYLKVMNTLAEAEVEKVELKTEGIWIGDGEKPKQIAVSDHIACHRDNILTGSVASKRGEAFVDMRDAYLKSDVDRAGDGIVIWHLGNEPGISDKEREIAGKAGCDAASRYVAPWAIAAKVAGVGISAMVKEKTFD